MLFFAYCNILLQGAFTELNSNFSDFLMLKRHENNYTVGANASGGVEIDVIAVEGYKPIGVVSASTNYHGVVIVQFGLINDNAQVGLAFTNSKPTEIKATATIDVMYAKIT